jgi:hypothetical protein
MLAGLIPSVGTLGDALDNALAEMTIGLYETECVRDGSPFRTSRRRGCTGTTRPGSCTGSAASAQQSVGQHTDHT